MARSTFRSVSYDLESVMEVARQLSSRPGGTSSTELASALGYSGARNGAFLTRLANARLFGLVTGASGGLTLTDRGRRAVSLAPTDSGPARREALLAVPLFRALVERYAGSEVPSRDRLESELRVDFGESPAKARVTATKFLDSVRQAGALQPTPSTLTAMSWKILEITDFTAGTGLDISRGVGSVHEQRSLTRASRRRVRTHRTPWYGREVGVSMDPSAEGDRPATKDEPEGLWLADEAGERDRHGALRRRGGVAVAAVVCLAVVAVPVSLALTASGSPPQASGRTAGLARLSGGPAVSTVLNALSATTDSGNFQFTYSLTGTPATTTPPPTTTTTVPAACPMAAGQTGAAVSGGGSLSVGAASGTSSFKATGSASASHVSSGSVQLVPATSPAGVPLPNAVSPGGVSVPPAVCCAGPIVQGPVSPARSPAVPPATVSPGVIMKSAPTGRTNSGSAVKVAAGNRVTASRTSLSAVGCMAISPGTPTETPVSGNGTIDVNPLAMVATAAVGSTTGSGSTSGLNVVVRLDSSTLWEQLNGGSAGLSGGPASSGQSISGFSGLVLGTLGNRNGAVAMLGMASPTGYLDLDQQQVSNADKVGTGAVGGVPVTIYQVQVSPAQEAQVPGASAEETTTITDALTTLKAEGYTGTTVELSIDGEGYIRQAVSTAKFTDGGTSVLSVTLSDFGCAGTVLMPGQQGSGVPPTPCTSPVPTTSTTPTTGAQSPVPTTSTSTTSTSTTVAAPPTTAGGKLTPTTIVVPPNQTLSPSTTTSTSAGG